MTGRRQILTGDVLGWLKGKLPGDGFCLLAITMEDLYPEASWNFVFGQASLNERVGAYSFARYDPAFYGERRGKDYPALLLQRSMKVLTQETGHMFGLAHCIYFHCVMNGSSHLPARHDQRQGAQETELTPAEAWLTVHRAQVHPAAWACQTHDPSIVGRSLGVIHLHLPRNRTSRAFDPSVSKPLFKDETRKVRRPGKGNASALVRAMPFATVKRPTTKRIYPPNEEAAFHSASFCLCFCWQDFWPLPAQREFVRRAHAVDARFPRSPRMDRAAVPGPGA
jgi:hypothetical protein